MIPARAVAGVMAAAIVGGSVPACTPADAGRSGGTAVLADDHEPDSFLAAGITDRDPNAYAAAAPVMEGLLQLRREGDPRPGVEGPAAYWEPQLATEVPTLAGGGVRTAGHGMDVTWKLRHGVRWQDGKPFTSRDVWATFEFRWLRYGAHNPTPLVSTSGWDQVTGVSTPDAYTAVVHFKSVYAGYLALGSGPYGILPAHLLEQAWSQGGDLTRSRVSVDIPGGFAGTAGFGRVMVGTGPFMFKDWQPGDHLTLVRNPGWWGGKAHLDYLYVQFEPDLKSELDAVRSGSVQAGLDAGAGSLVDLARLPGVVLAVSPASGVEKIDLNLANRYLADPAVRRAILLAIDRRALVRALLGGRTRVPPDSWLCIGTGAWCRDPAAPRTAFDPARARALLDAAGFRTLSAGPDGGYRRFSDGSVITLRLVAPADDPLRRVEQAVIAGDLRAIGLKVVLPGQDPDPALLFGSYEDGGLLLGHQFDMALYGASYPVPAAPSSLDPSYLCAQIPGRPGGDAGANDTSVCDPRLDSALEVGAGTVDPGRQVSAYASAQRLLAAILPEVPLYQQVVVTAVTKRLHGYQGGGFFWTAGAQLWWVDR